MTLEEIRTNMERCYGHMAHIVFEDDSEITVFVRFYEFAEDRDDEEGDHPNESVVLVRLDDGRMVAIFESDIKSIEVAD